MRQIHVNDQFGLLERVDGSHGSAFLVSDGRSSVRLLLADGVAEFLPLSSAES